MIYICIPAHNEEQTVGVVLWKIRQVMGDFPRDYQLLVVDDASTDKTADVLSPYARVLPLTVVRTASRQGEGAALEMMLREAVRRSEYPKRDIIITLQADFTQEPDELIGLIKRMEAGADIVVGQSLPDDKVQRAARWARALAVRVLGRRRIPEGVTDPFTGYRAYRVLAVRKALEERTGRLMHWGGWAGAAELLLATAPHARRIETADVVTRRERLQRPSRLQPWVALKEVWALAREARPLVNATPAQLDEAMLTIAAVRTSELHISPAERAQRSAARRGSSEERSRRGSPARERPRSSERPRRDGAERAPRSEEEQRRSRREREPKRPSEPAAERPQSRRPRRTPQATSTPPVPEPLIADEVPVSAEPTEVTAATPAEQAEKRKRRRPRRRKRPGSAASAATGESVDGVLEGILDGGESEAAADVGEDGGAEGMTSPAADGETDGGQKSRRRRRGRRGGRRRNRETNGAPESGEGSQPAEPTAEQIAIFELLQGDQSHET